MDDQQKFDACLSAIGELHDPENITYFVKDEVRRKPTSRFRRFWNAYRYYRWHYGLWASLRAAWKYPDRWIYDGDSRVAGVGKWRHEPWVAIGFGSEVEDPYWYFNDQTHPSSEGIALAIKTDEEMRKRR
jgi:hypothetical protein